MPPIDLNDHRGYAGSQPHAMFDWLRANDPVHRHPEPSDKGPGYWALTRFDDVDDIGRDHARFSSSPTIMIPDPDPGTSDPDHVMMLMADPPVRTRMRRRVSRQFTPRAARALEPRLAALATQIVDEVVERGECESGLRGGRSLARRCSGPGRPAQGPVSSTAARPCRGLRGTGRIRLVWSPRAGVVGVAGAGSDKHAVQRLYLEHLSWWWR